MTETLRHITSINDLAIAEIEAIFTLADRYLEELGDPARPYRIARSANVAPGAILASLFYEPSTRTRLSFESAMLRLGGKTISSADPATSSAAKGESLADTVRVASSYADILVIRHPRDGAAKLAAEYASVPVINGGDGGHEHPTQTICDVFTLKRESGDLRKMNVAISGDLRGSRTVHSFVYALARFGANIFLMPAKGMELPAHVDWRLRNEFKCHVVPKEKYEGADSAVDALYVTADEPHQLSLIASADIDLDVKIKKNMDVVYVTRFQKERWADKDQNYPTINATFLKGAKYAHTSLLHPLPRVSELDISLDSDRRAAYFRQAAYGVPTRMALIALLLGIEKENVLARYESGLRAHAHPVYEQPSDIGARCVNLNCIVHDEMERKYTRNKFHLVETNAARLRCFYCETDVADFVVANRRTKHYSLDAAELRPSLEKHPKDAIVFTDEASARAAGYVPRKGKPPARTSLAGVPKRTVGQG